MSTFSYPITLTNPDTGASLDVQALVETGAFFTTLPQSILNQLGVTPTESRRFRVADGRVVEMDIGEARVHIDGKSVTTIVAFGEANGPNLLGAYTLEGLSLAVDPVSKRLVSRAMIMYAA